MYFNIDKKEKGQIIFLDVLFAVVLIILMFFLLSKWSEINVYTSNSNKSIYELNKIGELAFNKLTTNPKTTCYASDIANVYSIPTSVFSNSNITKENLGLPNDYKCYFSVDSFTLNNNQCNDNFILDNPKHYFAIDFNIITSNTKNITKEAYFKSILSGSSLTKHIAELKVWK